MRGDRPSADVLFSQNHSFEIPIIRVTDLCGEIISFVIQLRAVSVLLAIVLPGAAGAATSVLDVQFEQTVRPFVIQYCVGCHSGKAPAAQFDLKSYTTVDMVTADYPRWALVMERLAAKEMPPKPVAPPPVEASRQVIAWIQALRADLVKKSAGDPGVVLARRLSNAEYNYTIRDLTGQDIQITQQFPVDPANPAGFDNSGESLTMSPALLNKYLQAAREVANHMVLKPDAINFAPYPMLVETDCEKYAIQRISASTPSSLRIMPITFRRHGASGIEPHWENRVRRSPAIAADSKLSPKYLPMVWRILDG